jgi:hypothetical protein
MDYTRTHTLKNHLDGAGVVGNLREAITTFMHHINRVVLFLVLQMSIGELSLMARGALIWSIATFV